MRKSVVALSLLAVGLILILLQLITTAPDFIRLLGVEVETPQSYDFPEYDRALKACVKGKLVDYKCLQTSPDFQAAVKQLERISPDKFANKEDEVAYWTNAYNILILRNILRQYPIVDTRQLGQSTSMNRYVVGGKLFTIQDIEIDKLRPLATKYDALSVFLQSSGARGSPPLLDHAIQPLTYKEDATVAARDFINDPRNTAWNPQTRIFYISQYFRRIQRNVHAEYPNVFFMVNSFLAPNLQVDVSDPNQKLKFFGGFDTRLNDVAADTKDNAAPKVDAVSKENQSPPENAVPPEQTKEPANAAK
jgi:hypothetical protein